MCINMQSGWVLSFCILDIRRMSISKRWIKKKRKNEKKNCAYRFTCMNWSSCEFERSKTQEFCVHGWHNLYLPESKLTFTVWISVVWCAVWWSVIQTVIWNILCMGLSSAFSHQTFFNQIKLSLVWNQHGETHNICFFLCRLCSYSGLSSETILSSNKANSSSFLPCQDGNGFSRSVSPLDISGINIPLRGIFFFGFYL